MTITLFEGHDPNAGDVACIEIAVFKRVVVQLDEPVGGRAIVDGAADRGLRACGPLRRGIDRLGSRVQTSQSATRSNPSRAYIDRASSQGCSHARSAVGERARGAHRDRATRGPGPAPIGCTPTPMTPVVVPSR